MTGTEDRTRRGDAQAARQVRDAIDWCNRQINVAEAGGHVWMARRYRQVAQNLQSGLHRLDPDSWDLISGR